jgi:hypothetical protein
MVLFGKLKSGLPLVIFLSFKIYLDLSVVNGFKDFFAFETF